MNGPNITIVGAGSLLFTIQIIGSSLKRQSLANARFTLYDIDEERLNLVYSYSVELSKRTGGSLTVVKATDRDMALIGADYVIVTVAVGGLALKKADLETAKACGIIQPKGDTTGPAGIFRGLRNIPFFIGLSLDMERLCPSAVMINLSNPMSTIMGAVMRESSVKTVGVCTSVQEIGYLFASYLGVERERLSLHSVGVNHFTWLVDMYLDGKSRLDLLADVIVPAFDNLPVTVELYESYGLFPIPGYRYASEFFGCYGSSVGFDAFDEKAALKSFNNAWDMYTAELAGEKEFTLAHGNTDSEAVASIIESMHANIGGIHILNCANAGQLPFLPADAVVEGPVFLGGDRLLPLACPKEMPESIKMILKNVVKEHKLIIDAALTGDKRMVMEALLMDKLVPSPTDARLVFEKFMEAERDYLQYIN